MKKERRGESETNIKLIDEPLTQAILRVKLHFGDSFREFS